MGPGKALSLVCLGPGFWAGPCREVLSVLASLGSAHVSPKTSEDLQPTWAPRGTASGLPTEDAALVHLLLASETLAPGAQTFYEGPPTSESCQGSALTSLSLQTLLLGDLTTWPCLVPSSFGKGSSHQLQLLREGRVTEAQV